MPRCLHPPGSRRQAVYRSGVHLSGNEFLAYAVPDSGRKTAAPDGSKQSLRVKQGAALLLLVSAPLQTHGLIFRRLSLRSSEFSAAPERIARFLQAIGSVAAKSGAARRGGRFHSAHPHRWLASVCFKIEGGPI